MAQKAAVVARNGWGMEEAKEFSPATSSMSALMVSKSPKFPHVQRLHSLIHS